MDRDVLLNDLRLTLNGFDFCGSKLEDAWCEHVSPLGVEFVSDWVRSKGFPADLDNDEHLELVLELSGLVLDAFVQSVVMKSRGN